MEELTRRAVAWAAAAWGREVATVTPLTGGWTSTMLTLSTQRGDRAVLRLMTREPWRRHAVGLLTREASVQRLLETTDVVAPSSLALDPDGDSAGAPAHLMTWCPGDLELVRHDDVLLGALSRILVRIHGVDPGTDRPRDYQSWAGPEKRIVPPWAADSSVWRRAFALLDGPAPSYDGRFLHRDLHLGNVLWSAGRVTGVVDWVETSWGPADLDVAHASTNLAMLHGPEVAERFERLHPEPVATFWGVMDAVGFLPDPGKVVQPWRDRGIAISDALARDHLERHLARLLAR